MKLAVAGTAFSSTRVRAVIAANASRRAQLTSPFRNMKRTILDHLARVIIHIG